MNRSAISLLFVTALGCTETPKQAPARATPDPPAAPVAKETPTSESIRRAEALIEDLKRREAAQAKFDRENVAPAAVPIPRSQPTSQPTPPPSNGSASAAPVPAPPPGVAAAVAAPARDELWWKQEMQRLQASLDGELVKLAAAEKGNWKYGYNDLQAMYKAQVAAVAEARLAIERLHDEARRAGVPPGWLRP